MTQSKDIRVNIKQYIKDNGISQTHISNKTHIRPSILNAILNSKRNLMADEYFLICEALGVSPDIFWKREAV